MPYPAVGAALANHKSIYTTQFYYNQISAGRVNDAGAQLAATRRSVRKSQPNSTFDLVNTDSSGVDRNKTVRG